MRRSLSLAVFFFCLRIALPAAEPTPEPGFVPLFNGKDVGSTFVVKGLRDGWKVENGALVAKVGAGRILTRDRYDHFVLRLEYKLSRHSNSGVLVRVPSPEDRAPWETGIEVDLGTDPSRRAGGKGTEKQEAPGSGGLRKLASPERSVEELPETWRALEVTCLGSRVSVRIDGKLVTDVNSEKAPGLLRRSPEGHIGFEAVQAGVPGSTIQYRNLRIQRLSRDGSIPGFESVTLDPGRWRPLQVGKVGASQPWSFANGAWTGRQDPPGADAASLNVTELPSGDFELIAEVIPCHGGASGIVLRATGAGSGYRIRVEDHSGGNFGGILGEQLNPPLDVRSYVFGPEAGSLAAGFEPPPGTPGFAVAPDLWKRQWNPEEGIEVRARVQGNPPLIEVWVNGMQVTRFVDDKKRLPDTGLLGLLVPGGKGWPAQGKVVYRNIFVRPLQR